MKDTVVAVVEKSRAIDFTLIYSLKFIGNVKAGEELEFDTAESVITRPTPPNPSTHV